MILNFFTISVVFILRLDRIGGVLSAMEEHGIVSELIDVTPNHLIHIRFPSGVEANNGNELTPLSVKDEPSIEWPVEPGQFYTFVMIDPDAPSRENPSLGPVKHWLVVNIPGTDLSKGELLAAFISSTPPEGTGLHRYVFLVYKQPGLLKHSEAVVTDMKMRMHFKIGELAKKYNLGQPIAANFYLTQSDDYSREVWANFNKQGINV